MLHSTATGKATLAAPNFGLHWAAKEYRFVPSFCTDGDIVDA
ncbi:hypothetical protein [Bradyrhizobium iriomotense]|nr:hypothetical protein [Bradyrhizobium iriomotense]